MGYDDEVDALGAPAKDFGPDRPARAKERVCAVSSAILRRPRSWGSGRDHDVWHRRLLAALLVAVLLVRGQEELAQLPGIPEASGASPAATSEGIPEAPGASPAAASSMGSRTLSATMSEDSELRYTVKNTFIDIEPVGATPVSSVSQSCTARLGAPTPQHLPAPPAYAAPATFQQEEMTPPPSSSPGEQAGGQVLVDAFGNLGNSPCGSSSAPSPYPDQAQDMRITVKNTFIDVEGAYPSYDDRYTLSCTARLGAPPAPFPSPTGGGCGVADFGCFPVAVQAAPAAGAQLNQGSELHGTVGEDGLPACQPCAWFHKDAGCLNATDCRYCHLCPQGELKIRKKQKIARLRNQEAHAGATPPGAGNAAPAKATAATAARRGA